jgi:hypothetical protein
MPAPECSALYHLYLFRSQVLHVRCKIIIEMDFEEWDRLSGAGCHEYSSFTQPSASHIFICIKLTLLV